MRILLIIILLTFISCGKVSMRVKGPSPGLSGLQNSLDQHLLNAAIDGLAAIRGGTGGGSVLRQADVAGRRS